MKRIIFYGIIIFVFSIGIGYYYSKIWEKENMSQEVEIIDKNIVDYEEISVSATEEKVSFDAVFALKKYYNECGHSNLNYVELPNELINLTENEINKLYSNWRVEKFSSKEIVLAQNIDTMCNDHYLLKLGNENIEIYKVQEAEDYKLLKETNISKDYLTEKDISKLEEGIFVFGISNLNSALEDFE